MAACAGQDLDPAGGRLGPAHAAVRRAGAEGAEDAALQALDYRIAAEILLLFYEDLADRNQAGPLPDARRNGAASAARAPELPAEQTLDEDLVDLGISPHPRVVLAVEGETEKHHVPLVWRALGYPDAPGLMRLLKLGAANRDLEKVAALAAAPLVGRKSPGQRPAWLLIKPYTWLLVAVDPEPPYHDTRRVARDADGRS